MAKKSVKNVGVPRTIGIIFAIFLFAVLLIVFNILPLIEQTQQLRDLRESAQQYDRIFTVLQSETQKYQRYHQTLLPFQKDLDTLIEQLKNLGYGFTESGGKFSFKGSMTASHFAWLLENLSMLRGVRVEQMEIRNSFQFPIIVGQAIQPVMEFRSLVIARHQANASLLRR